MCAAKNRSPSSIPPAELPKNTPVRSRQRSMSSDAEATASSAAATANRSARERWRAGSPGSSPSGTSAARCVRCRAASNRLNGATAVTPRRTPSQSRSTPQPNGVTAPKPVTTMSGGREGIRSAPGMRVGCRKKTTLDVRGEGGHRSEGLASDLVALDAKGELLLQRDHQLERVDRVETEPFAEQRHVVRDTLGGQALQVKLVDQEMLDPLSGRGVVRHNVGSREFLKRRGV